MGGRGDRDGVAERRRHRRRVRAEMQAVSPAIAANIPCHRNSRARPRLCIARTSRKPKAGARRGRSFPRECEDLQGRRDGACVTECALGVSFRLAIASSVAWTGRFESAGATACCCVGRDRDRDRTWKATGGLVARGGINRPRDKRGRRVATLSSNRRYGYGSGARGGDGRHVAPLTEQSWRMSAGGKCRRECLELRRGRR